MSVNLSYLAWASTAALLLIGLPSAARADASDATRVTVKSGSAGYWDRFGLAHPSEHHIVTCEPKASGNFTTNQGCGTNTYGKGDWSLDFYLPAGSSVRYDAVGSGGTLTAKVWAIQPTCSQSSAGKTVFIDLYIGSAWEGWVSYSHLDQVAVSVGQTISPSQIIGKTKKWSYSTCWQVSSDAGVHTHIEMWDKYRYSCYTNYQSRTYLGSSMNLGVVGRTIYTGIRSRC